MADAPLGRDDGEPDPAGGATAEEAPPGATPKPPSLLAAGAVGLEQDEAVVRTTPLRGWRRVLGVLVIITFVVALIAVPLAIWQYA